VTEHCLSLGRVHVALAGVARGPTHCPATEALAVAVAGEQEDELERVDEPHVLDLGGG
jgi:hypothetical protein